MVPAGYLSQYLYLHLPLLYIHKSYNSHTFTLNRFRRFLRRSNSTKAICVSITNIQNFPILFLRTNNIPSVIQIPTVRIYDENQNPLTSTRKIRHRDIDRYETSVRPDAIEYCKV